MRLESSNAQLLSLGLERELSCYCSQSSSQHSLPTICNSSSRVRLPLMASTGTCTHVHIHTNPNNLFFKKMLLAYMIDLWLKRNGYYIQYCYYLQQKFFDILRRNMFIV